MSSNSTAARPYAKAVFELAFAGRSLAQWSKVLALSALVAEDKQFAGLLDSPRVTPQQLAEALIDIVTQALAKDGGGSLDEQGKNLLRLLAEYRRLGALPQIAAEFEQMRADSENTVDVSVASAAPLNDAQLRAYSEALTKRLKREVRLHPTVDPSLMGGAILRANDLVIDGSVRGRLERLRSELIG